MKEKKTTAELFGNITEKRFQNEIVRMSEFQQKFLILEFSFTDVLNFPRGSGIPKTKWKYMRVTPQFVIKKLAEYNVKYGISVIYAGNTENAIYCAVSIMKEVFRAYGFN